MSSLAKAVFGFCLISIAYGAATLLALSVLVMSHCVLSDAQIAAGETCVQPTDQFFWPIAAVAVIGFVGIQWIFLRWTLRKKP